LSARRAKINSPKTNQKCALFAFRPWSDDGAAEEKFRDGSSLRRLIQIPAKGLCIGQWLLNEKRRCPSCSLLSKTRNILHVFWNVTRRIGLSSVHQRRKLNAEEASFCGCRSWPSDVYGQRGLLHCSGEGDEEVQSR
jgi:hypothetical protein